MSKKPERSPGVLLILDGWGLGEDNEDNPIHLADTPYFDKLDYREIEAVGTRVGMPADAKGSTAVGHEVMSGVNYIHPMRQIQKNINDKVFINQITDREFKDTAQKGGALHLMGLVSNNMEHSDIRHLYAILRRAVAKGIQKIYIHFFSDGRGTPPFSAVRFAEDLTEKTDKIASSKVDIEIATVGGRDITMNRSDDSFNKSLTTQSAIIDAQGPREKDIFTVLKKAYDKGITDQYVDVTVLGNYKGAANNDMFLHWNFRKDRAWMLMYLMTEPEKRIKKKIKRMDYKKTKREKTLDYSSLKFMTLIEVYKDVPCEVVYPDKKQEYSLGSSLEDFGYSQFRISGVDKAQAVVLLSGGSRVKPFKHEKRITISLPKEMKRYSDGYDKNKGEKGYKLDPYEKYPEIEIKELTKKIVSVIKDSRGKEFLIINIANGDMVGHTANREASIRAASAVDKALKKISAAVLDMEGTLFITADHGNLEVLHTEDGTPSTFHTKNKVPFAMVSKETIADETLKFKSGGCLKDVAPTVLAVMEPSYKKIIKETFMGEILAGKI
ncbi:MAG: hypothetical protein PF545_07315 [Elusimicrobia bacterium]|jgi:2,3-bisphosphoglycerate-independent phosphoglycerate mutase|nr:hypothetical protein [Elusimicrobiota bacterium]